MSVALRIENRIVASSAPPYVIAEIGVNHDGDLTLGRELVRVARDAGADAVKFQLFAAELLVSADARLARYQEKLETPDPRTMLRELELSTAAMAALVREARNVGVQPIVTVFSTALVEVAATMDVAAFKTASPDIVHRPLLDALARTGRPLIVSTGAASLDEVERACGWLAGRPFALLQCVSSYPTPDEDAGLRGIGDLARFGAPVGYSDHTVGIDTGAFAVAAGATILEKHLTHDRDAAGPDHATSLDAAQFAEYVRQARRAHRMLGEGKRVSPIEEDVRCVSRQSLVAARALQRGAPLGPADLTVKRPGTGIAPWRLEEVLGRTLARDVAADRVLRDEDLA